MTKWHILAIIPMAACAGETGEDEVPTPLVAQFGFEDERSFTLIADASDELDVPRDLAFNPSSPDHLWVVNRATDSTTIIYNPGTDEQDSENRQDVFANHFMEEVSSLSFGENNAFTTCQESMNTYDGTSSPNGFMGPALWPGDLEIYAEVNQNPWGSLLGSHLDMLHQSPLCMGAEWVSGNAYWIFDGKNENLVLYDFQEDHGPGGDDHSDGIVRRHSDVELERLADEIERVPDRRDGVRLQVQLP